MWYEIIPSVAAMFGGLCLSGLFPFTLRFVLQDTYYHMPRHLKATKHDYMYFIRDKSMTGSNYKFMGLENVPDAEPEVKE